MKQTLNTDLKRQAENHLLHECLFMRFSPGTFSQFQVSRFQVGPTGEFT